ncbi:PH domain-containing protein [Nocardioides sp.]|uniref:PH domain-containing protein n=1 Tax=Nocardioides sp. TaxID=35761 RepID=UPI00352914AC
MPAGSETSPSGRDSAGGPLPHTWRPLGVRLAGWIFGVSLLVVVVVAWLAVPASVRDATSFLQRVTLLGFLVLGLAIMHALMRCRVTAHDDGLTVINGYRRHEFAWAQVLGVSLPAGAPWATLDLADGTTVSAMGIQGSDGQRARDAVRELRSLIDAG